MRKQLIVLFLCSFCMSAVGYGLSPLLPLYGLSLGATSGTIGIIMSCGYVALALGTWVGGRLAGGTWSHTRILVVVGLLNAPALGLIGETTTTWQFAGLLISAWLCGGMAGALINILVGYAAEGGRRGRTFGVMFLAEPIGAFVGAPLLGGVVELAGYEMVFVVAGGAALVWPLLCAFGLREGRGQTRAAAPALEGEPQVRGSRRAFMLLLGATVLATIPIFVGRLGMSFSMEAGGFSPSAISSTVTISGLATLVLLPMLSLLSDRLGRRTVAIIAYLLTVTGMVVLVNAGQLWHFWTASALLSLAGAAGSANAAAFTTDLLPRGQLARGLPLLSMASWAAAIIGSAGTGHMLALAGAQNLYLLCAALALGGVALIALIGQARPTSERAHTTHAASPVVLESTSG